MLFLTSTSRQLFNKLNTYFMKNSFFIFALILVMLHLGEISAQKPPMKYGRIDKDDMNMVYYPLDTSASAVILCDYGSSGLTYRNDEILMYFERHCRIKILTKNGFDQANIEIPYYREANFNKLKACTYNMVEGKIVESKISRKEFLDENTTEYWKIRKFAFTNVKEGSIIEYNYRITSPYIRSLHSWKFQFEIPVRYSEYNVEYPEYFDYKILNQGYEYVKKEKNTVNISFAGKIIPGTSYRWVAQKIPTFKEEPYITTTEDYVNKVSFELSNFNIPGIIYENYFLTYSAVNKELLDDADFGKALLRGRFIKEQLDLVIAGLTSDEEKMKAILAFVKKSVKWNEENGVSLDNSLKKAYDEKTGDVAEINLLLVMMLKEAGLDAEPVILSTRSHGKLHPYIVMTSKFNYVIATVKIEDKEYLLDATEPLLAYDLLPARSINGNGLKISEQNCKWINLRVNKQSGKYMNIALSLKPDGELSGRVQFARMNYEAYRLRKIIEQNGEDEYLKNLKEDNPEWIIENHAFEKLDETDENISEKYDVEISGSAQVAGDLIYLNPFFLERWEKNPFKLEERKYPVDLTYPFNETYILTLEIPEGYVVEELPQKVVMLLPDKSAQFSFNAGQIGNKIQVSSRIVISKNIYKPDEYPSLKELYTRVVAKQAEQIVLKKAE